MNEKPVSCPDCGSRVRPCNLARHRQSHIPEPVTWSVVEEGWVVEYTFLFPAKRPLVQYRTRDHRYDEAFPRGEGPYRVRIYRLRGGELQMIALASSASSAGVALFDLYAQGAFIKDDSVGVLDTMSEPGDWIVHPFALGRTRAPDG